MSRLAPAKASSASPASNCRGDNDHPILPRHHRSGSDGYGVFFPDLDGCTSAGDTIQQAAVNAEEALQGHVELMVEGDDALPHPSDLDAVPVQDEVKEAARVLVRVEVPGKAVRVNITMPEDLLAAVDRYAKRTGFTRSGLLAQAVRDRLQADREAA